MLFKVDGLAVSCAGEFASFDLILGFSSGLIERIVARNGFEPPQKYYQKIRLNRERQLLEQTRMSQAEIALACGYENQSHFGRSNKKIFGRSPKAFRDLTRVV